MECNICFEKMNKSSRKEVVCPQCNDSYCSICFGRYLMECQQEHPSCMSCDKDISMEFIHRNTTKVFMKKYRDHLTKHFFEREKSLLPQTQQFAEGHIFAEKLKKDRKELRDKISEQKRVIWRMNQEYTNIGREIWRIEYAIRTGNPIGNPLDPVKKDRAEFVKKCVVDDCKGFLSSAWKCGICSTFVCSKCHVPKKERDDDTHVCDENIVKTIKMLSKDTKACPGENCGIPIHKIDGCDQMWCTSCETAFSWNTLRIQRGRIHNPHYYERLRMMNGGEIPR